MSGTLGGVTSLTSYRIPCTVNVITDKETSRRTRTGYMLCLESVLLTGRVEQIRGRAWTDDEGQPATAIRSGVGNVPTTAVKARQRETKCYWSLLAFRMNYLCNKTPSLSIYLPSHSLSPPVYISSSRSGIHARILSQCIQDFIISSIYISETIHSQLF